MADQLSVENVLFVLALKPFMLPIIIDCLLDDFGGLDRRTIFRIDLDIGILQIKRWNLGFHIRENEIERVYLDVGRTVRNAEMTLKFIDEVFPPIPLGNKFSIAFGALNFGKLFLDLFLIILWLFRGIGGRRSYRRFQWWARFALLSHYSSPADSKSGNFNFEFGSTWRKY